MKTLIVSPHTDDGIFSLGRFITNLENVTILSVFAGIPTDPKGKRKHTKLRKEHTKACQIVGAKEINLDFLDDVYPRPEEKNIIDAIRPILSQFDRVYIPLGIHHPDHIWIRNIFIQQFPVKYFYEELPYAVRYPELTKALRKNNNLTRLCPEIFGGTVRKSEAVRAYQSQIDDAVIHDVLQPETLWKV